MEDNEPFAFSFVDLSRETNLKSRAFAIVAGMTIPLGYRRNQASIL